MSALMAAMCITTIYIRRKARSDRDIKKTSYRLSSSLQADRRKRTSYRPSRPIPITIPPCPQWLPFVIQHGRNEKKRLEDTQTPPYSNAFCLHSTNSAFHLPFTHIVIILTQVCVCVCVCVGKRPPRVLLSASQKPPPLPHHKPFPQSHSSLALSLTSSPSSDRFLLKQQHAVRLSTKIDAYYWNQRLSCGKVPKAFVLVTET
jgi:hypothetical protein